MWRAQHTQFQLVEERKPSLQQLEEQIDALSTELSDKRQEQTTLDRRYSRGRNLFDRKPSSFRSAATSHLKRKNF